MVFVGRAFLVEEASSKAFGVGVCVMCFRNNERGDVKKMLLRVTENMRAHGI